MTQWHDNPVPPEGPVHLDRARAESFGTVAAEYDRYRPSYPDALIDDLMAARPATVLDIGCGTGKAARLVAARGPSVLGVEIDPGMAAVARGHGIEVEIGSFEDWDDRGRRFDLIISGQAWHWVDPDIGAPKAARLLADGGAIALFWNYDELDTASQAVVDGVYAALAPQLRDAGPNKPGDRVDQLRATGAFGSIDVVTYPWQRTVSADEWVGVVGTQSAHLMLGPERLARVQEALRAGLHTAGGAVRLTGGTYTIWARP
jgi:SAM-dependent methyltransferase